MRYTANDAKRDAGPTLDEKIDAILDAIKLAANDRKRELKTGWQYKEDKSLWIDGGYSTSPDWLEATKVLTDLGYDVSFYYQEHQFVDMYTLIKW